MSITENNASTQTMKNPLGEERINKLLRQFAIPSIVSMLVGSLYNIVDQFFIGQSVGELGNAATNIAFPLSTSCMAAALLFGIGGASAFNITLGSGNRKKAVYYLGNAVVMLFGCGLVFCILTQIFLRPLLLFFGSPDNVLKYAIEYTRITSIGFPFLILSTGGGHLIRADGSPRNTMICNLTGAIINTFWMQFLFLAFIGGCPVRLLQQLLVRLFQDVWQSGIWHIVRRLG